MESVVVKEINKGMYVEITAMQAKQKKKKVADDKKSLM